MTKYFTADLHLGHENIIKLCNREFQNIKQHDRYIIKMLNISVKEDDELYILGDVCLTNDVDVLRKYLKRINCKNIHIVVGNHDNVTLLGRLKNEGVIKSYHKELYVTEGENTIFCSHYPYKEWNGYYRGIRHAHGHVHGNVYTTRAIDVGVDNIGYRPFTFDEVISRCDYLQPLDPLERLDLINSQIQELYPDLSVPYIVNMCCRDDDIRTLLLRKLGVELDEEKT